jgi:hypothetical protein
VAYNGALKCTYRPTCEKQIDLIHLYGPCKGGGRNIKYSTRNDTMCRRADFQFTSGPSVPCQTCNPGTYNKTGEASECVLCKEGDYSTTENATRCTKCPHGNYAPKVQVYTKLDYLPEEFDTHCENSMEDYCAIFQGWIVAERVITVFPYMPEGVKLILNTSFNVLEPKGRLLFRYNGSDSEALTLIINNEEICIIYAYKRIYSTSCWKI